MKKLSSITRPTPRPVPPRIEKRIDTGVFDQVRAIIIEQLGVVDESKITPEARFVEDLGADSLDNVELVMAFEERFEIIIADEDAEAIVTVQNAVDYLRRKSKAA